MTKVAIIGAGASGIAACRALSEQGVEFVCFEKGSKIGGLWRFQNDNGMASTYQSLHINTSKRKMEYDDLPMPDNYPDFPHHEQIIEYFEHYVEHFQLGPHIRFNHTVQNVQRDKDEWHLSLTDGSRHSFSHLIVANGHHWDPKWPDPKPPGHFSGIEMHSHNYASPLSPHDLREKNVVVVGMGNSAMDIACELSRKGVASKVWLSARSGVHIMPKYFGSKVLDNTLRHPTARPEWWEYILHLLPRAWRTRIFSAVISHQVRTVVGRPEDFGLPKPKTKFFQAHPTVSNEIHARLGSGDLLPKPGIKSFEGQQVKFVDGSVEHVDALIYGTGYNIRFPFFDHQMFNTEGNEVVLYKRIFSPEYNNLYFVGLVQPLCALMPIAQLQSRLVVAHINDRYQLPSAEAMRRQMREEYEYMKNSYTASTRHTIQIDCLEYSWDLAKEKKRGKKRNVSMVAL